MKSKGPRTEPCGTPDRTGDHSEKQPMMTTYCRLVVKDEENHCSIEPQTPKASNFNSKH